MKKYLKYLFAIVILLIAGGYVYYAYFFSDRDFAPDQEEIISTFGYPKRFSISYVQYAEVGEDLLVRQEVWYYPSHQQSITFLGGDILSLDDIDEEVSDNGEITYSDLHPEDFEFAMGYDEVAAVIGGEVVKNDFVSEFFTEDLENYIGDHIFFTIEHGHLTYIETVGLDLGEEEEI